MAAAVTYRLDCGHPAPEGDYLPGDIAHCHTCPKTERWNESRTASWLLTPLRRVIASRIGGAA